MRSESNPNRELTAEQARNAGVVKDKRYLVTVCDDGMEIYKYWDGKRIKYGYIYPEGTKPTTRAHTTRKLTFTDEKAEALAEAIRADAAEYVATIRRRQAIINAARR